MAKMGVKRGGGGRGEERRQGEGKLGREREREREVDTGERRRERSGAFPRTVGPRNGVGCPALISARSRSGFSSNPVLPKQRERWVDKERDLCIFFFSSGHNKKKVGTTHPICREQFSFLSSFFPIKKDKQRMIHRFHTGVRF